METEHALVETGGGEERPQVEAVLGTCSGLGCECRHGCRGPEPASFGLGCPGLLPPLSLGRNWHAHLPCKCAGSLCEAAVGAPLSLVQAGTMVIELFDKRRPEDISQTVPPR